MPLHDALVVALHPSGDTTFVVELLTPSAGRLSCVARGARRSRQRFAGALDVLNRVSAETTPPRRGELHDLVQAGLTDAFPGLRTDPLSFGRAAYIAELAAALSTREHATPGVFECALHALHALSTSPAGAGLLRWAEVQLLVLIGELHPTDRCCVCGKRVVEPVHADRHHPGHLRCGACCPPDAVPLPADVAALLCACATWDAAQARDAVVDARASVEAGRWLNAVLAPLLPRPLRSRRYLAQLQRTPGST